MLADEDPEGPPERRAYASQGLGLAYVARGDLPQARLYFEDALDRLLAEPESSPQMIVQTARNLADILERQKTGSARVRRLRTLADNTAKKIGEAPTDP
jgi:hypothetical protein